MCAARSCLGTEVTGGSCIARVGFVCRKEEKNQGDPHSSSSSSASRSRPAIASDNTSSRTSDSRCNRIEMVSLVVVNLREKKKREARTCSGWRSIMTWRNSMCFGVPRRTSPGGGGGGWSPSAARMARPNFQMAAHSTSSHRASRPNELRARGRSPRCIDRCNISERRRRWTLRADDDGAL